MTKQHTRFVNDVMLVFLELFDFTLVYCAHICKCPNQPVIPRLHDPANVRQISSKSRAVSTCILNTFAGRLLDRVNGVLVCMSLMRKTYSQYNKTSNITIINMHS